MKIVLVDANVRYLNPTRNLLPSVLRSGATVAPFGPGYVEPGVLRRGLRDFLKRIDGADLVLVTEVVLNSRRLDERTIASRYRKYYSSVPSTRDLMQLPELRAELNEGLDLPIVGSLLETDFHNLTREDVQHLDSSCDFFLAWGAELFPTTPPRAIESFSQRVSNDWQEFARDQKKRVISTTHYVAEHEIWGLPWNRRPISASVMGADYAARRVARAHLREVPGVTVKGTALRALSFAVRPVRHELPLLGRGSDSLQSFGFSMTLAASRVSYTCGSALEYPVRKFFEIPAHGALLACEPPQALTALGFEDGKTHLGASPDELPQIVRRALARPESSERMTSSARDLIQSTHSVSARSRQWRSAFEAIVVGRFRGSEWDSGDFRLL